MRIIDIHCHPSTKIFFGHKIQDKHNPLSDTLPTGMHVDLPRMKEGEVGCAISVHYIVEEGLLDANHNKALFFLLGVLQVFNPDVLRNLSAKEGRAATNTLASIQATVSAIADAPSEFNAVIATNFTEFKVAWESNKTVFIHSIEGGHSLSTDQPLAMIEQYTRAGVCQITIAHFFPNIVVSSQGGLPPHSKTLLHYVEKPQSFNGLNPENGIGELLVNKILDEGIIIDLVHCPPAARDRIFEINKERFATGKKLRPLVFSHTGIQACVDKNIIGESDFAILPTDEEIQKIIECKGVIGVIFMNYWLCGVEEDDILKRENGLDLVIKTMIKLKELGNDSCDHIAIGSDLDGFTQVPDDLVTSSDMQKVPKALKIVGFTDSEISKICHENYIRVLQLGWGI
jgi:microsomal dipeptidase-like Zn-dependent dipeptidase